MRTEMDHPAAERSSREPGQPVAARVESALLLEVEGDDAPAFLHGQLANDVRGLLVPGVGRSLYLNHRGHALAEVMVLRSRNTTFTLVEEGGMAAWVRSELQRHVIFDQVEVGAPAAAGLITVQGQGAERLVAELTGGATTAGAIATSVTPSGIAVRVYANERSSEGGYDLLGEPAAADALLEELETLGARRADAAALDLLRVRAGIARAPIDAGEGVLPQEAGLEGALSYRKGCYLGQEIMARIEARGKLRRGLRRVGLSEDPRVQEEVGASSDEAVGVSADAWRDVVLGGRTVGRLGTVAAVGDGFEALAVLRDDLPAGAELLTGSGARLHPLDPPPA